MKKSFFVVSVFFSLFFLSCKNEFNAYDSSVSTVSRVFKNKTGSFDSKPYYDVTLKDNNAFQVVQSDFSKYIKNSYMNGDNCIRFSKNNNTLYYDGICANSLYEGKRISFKYEYEIKAASSSLMYLKPKNPRTVIYVIDGVEMFGKDVPSFIGYIPLYGFGGGRLEVSSHLKGESSIVCGTYW